MYKTVAGARLTRRRVEDRATNVARTAAKRVATRVANAAGISPATLKIAGVLAVDPER
jgi:hypothetical protein